MKYHTIVITVNYRTPELVCSLIKSLEYELLHRKTLFFVVDNNSEDNSVAIIKNYIADNSLRNCIVLPAEENRGFSAGNNMALKHAKENNILFDYVWFLNPDTRLKNDSGELLRQFLQANNKHIAGSRLEDEDGTWQCSHFNYPSIFSELSQGLRLGLFDNIFSERLVRRNEVNEPCKTDWLAGASFMMTNESLRAVGLMDEKYFLYFEEVDYFLHAQRLGYTAWHVPASRVFHEVGASTKISDTRKSSPPRRPTYWFESRSRFYNKNYGFLKHLLADTAFLVGYSIWLLRAYFLDRNTLNHEPPQFFLDFLKNSIFYPRLKR